MNAHSAQTTTDAPYLIRNGASFYKPDRQGYTTQVEAAGIYSYAEARAEADARPGTIYITPLACFRHEIANAHALLTEKRRALGMIADFQDPELRRIENRHTQDAPWFRGGLHDPQGYVALAHADRGALLDHLRDIKSAPAIARSLRTLADVQALAAEYGLTDILLPANPPPPATPVTTKDMHATVEGHSVKLVPMAAWAWLMGEGPDDKGFHFEMGPPLGARGIYWWRSTFRRMCAA